MQTLESLITLVGQPVDSLGVKSLIVSAQLRSSTEEDLEEGEPVRSHLSSPDGGYEFSHTLGRLNTLFVYVRAKGKFAAFRGSLIQGLAAESTRADVRRTLGSPSRSCEAMSHRILGRYGAWDRFDSKDLCLHFQYTEPAEEIEQITVMTADAAP